MKYDRQYYVNLTKPHLTLPYLTKGLPYLCHPGGHLTPVPNTDTFLNKLPDDFQSFPKFGKNEGRTTKLCSDLFLICRSLICQASKKSKKEKAKTFEPFSAKTLKIEMSNDDI